MAGTHLCAAHQSSVSLASVCPGRGGGGWAEGSGVWQQPGSGGTWSPPSRKGSLPRWNAGLAGSDDVTCEGSAWLLCGLHPGPTRRPQPPPGWARATVKAVRRWNGQEGGTGGCQARSSFSTGGHYGPHQMKRGRTGRERVDFSWTWYMCTHEAPVSGQVVTGATIWASTGHRWKLRLQIIWVKGEGAGNAVWGAEEPQTEAP